MSLLSTSRPHGNIWSAVPLPCYFDVVNFQRVAGQRPREGTKSCRMGRNSVCPSVHLSESGGRQEGPEGQLEGSMGRPDGLRASQGGRMNEQMDKQSFSPFYRTLSPLGAAAQKELVA